MSTEYRIIESARYENVAEIYTSGGIVIWVRGEKSTYGEKFVIDENNIDDFIEAIYIAAKQNNIKSEYLNLE